MKVIKIPFDQIDQFSSRDKDYQLRPEIFQSFIEDLPSLEAIHAKIKRRNTYPIDRQLLVNHLHKSYESYDNNSAVLKQIESLENNNTFTVTTAHQLSLLGGPLYFILKILSTIQLAHLLNEQYPDQHFVPVFVHGSEDHDFDEINHLHLFNQLIAWSKDQGGPTGRMNLQDLDIPLKEVKERLGSLPFAEALKQNIDQSLASSNTYGAFMHSFVHELFADFGLVQLNMDDAILKTQFADVLKKEVQHQFSHHDVSETIERLTALGYKAQAKPREINIFYLTENARNRLVEEDGIYNVLNTNQSFDLQSLMDEIDQHPDKFSPNVILRPLYQERILPNLAYIGGGGEMAYWLERKNQFNTSDISFPILIRRNSAAISFEKNITQWQSMGLTPAELSLPNHKVTDTYLDRKQSTPLDIHMYQKEIIGTYKTMIAKIKELDPTLAKSSEAELTKSSNGLKSIESRIKKLHKQKEEVSLNRISKIQQGLFPDGNLQERRTNFMEFYAKLGPALFEELMPHLNPLEKDFQIFVFK